MNATLRTKNHRLADRAIDILEVEHPMTVRQLFYRLVSAGELPATDAKHYNRLGALLTRLREAGDVPMDHLVDHLRQTLKPSSWTGLEEFAEVVRNAYRKDFWASLDSVVEVYVEKDAVAATIQPITEQFDVALRVCRGYASVSFAAEIADEWREHTKPVWAYYLGDFDPSGFDIERDLRVKLEQYSDRAILDHDEMSSPWVRSPYAGQFAFWKRLGVDELDFESFDLIALGVKHSDRRARNFIRERGSRCAEIDALPPSELRARVEQAILSHVDLRRWNRLKRTEEIERESLAGFTAKWSDLRKVKLASVSGKAG